MFRVPFAVIAIPLLLISPPASAEEKPMPDTAALNAKFDKQISDYSKQIKNDPKDDNLYSRRGDAYFFRAKFSKAVADYEKMIELNPAIKPRHWRRGIAYFYAGRFKDAAAQFDLYHKIDDMDRENGIWRFFSQAKAFGIPKARKGLILYSKDDRAPLPDVYQMFAGKMTGVQILKKIESAKISKTEREKRLFYANLYIGLLADIQKKPQAAENALQAAVTNRWGPTAGFGPNYMWHVGRLHHTFVVHRRKNPNKNKN